MTAKLCPLPSRLLCDVFFAGIVAFAGAVASSADGRPATATVWLHWTFDSDQPFGYVERDASGNARDALLRWGRTRSGGGGRYDPGNGAFGGAAAVDDRGAIESRDNLRLPQAWTFSFWIKPRLIKRWDNLFAIRRQDRSLVAVSMDDAGAIRATISPTDGQSDLLIAKSAEMTTDAWTFIAITYGSDGMSLRVNQEVKQISKPLEAWPDDAARISLIALRGAPHHHFDGLADDLRIYDRALAETMLSAMADRESDFHRQEDLAPLVDAGLPQTLRLDAADEARIVLRGRVTDDGKGPDLKAKWRIKSSPADAETQMYSTRFTDGRAVAGCIAKSPGDYVFELIAGDTGILAAAPVRVSVFPRQQPHEAAHPYVRPKGELLPGLPQFEPERAERRDAVKGRLPVIARWTFDQVAENSVVDDSGKGHDFDIAATAGVPTTQGKIGGALELPGKDQKPQTVSFGRFKELAGEFSLSFWVRSTRDDNRGSLFKCPDRWEITTQVNKGGVAPERALLWWGNRNNHPARMQDWNHVIVTQGRGMKKLYHNGVLVGASKEIEAAAADTTEGGELLFNFGGVNYGFYGMLDDVTLYGCTLNIEEAAEMYDAGRQGKSSSTLQDRIPADPYMTRVYRREFVERYFPETEESIPVTGREEFAAERFTPPPAAHEHPRMFFTLDELPEIRRRLDSHVGKRKMSEIRQYLDVVLPALTDDQGRYRLTCRMEPAKEGGEPTCHLDTTADAALVAEAFRCLIDSDGPEARRLADWLVRTCEMTLAFAELHSPSADWQHVWHNSLLRIAVPILYDYLYPWMAEPQRATVRRAIATATQGKWSLGMYALPAMNAHLSNHETWVTGEYLIALMAIEGEEGFDPEAFAQASRALTRCSTLLADPESGATYEGMAKNLISAPVLAALSRRQSVDRQVIAGDMPYNHVRRFFLHASVPWGGWMMMDDLLGQVAPLRLNPPTILKHAYPNDAVIDYVYHSALAGRDDYGMLNLNSYGFAPEMLAWPLAADWSGPNDLSEHLRQAVRDANEPLGYFSNYRGLISSRSDWSPDALQLYFQPRSIIGGHALPTRGYFVINALGRTWNPFNGWYNNHSQHYSVTTVDGEGQDTTPAKVVHYDGATERRDARIDTLVGDMTACYRHTGSAELSLNDTRLRPDKTRPWMELPRKQLVDWHFGDRPQSVSAGEHSRPFAHALRSATLVRGKQPYVLIVEDIQKDVDQHEYRFGITLPDDIYQGRHWKVTGRDLVLSDPDGKRHLLIRSVGCDGFVGCELAEHGGGKDGKTIVPRMEIVSKSVNPQYKILLLPFRGAANDYQTVLRSSTWDAGTGTLSISIGDQQDRLSISEIENAQVKITER